MTKHFAAFLLASLPFATLAHTGHGSHGFMDVLTHFFLDIDLLLAMALIGALATLLARRVWPATASFFPRLSGKNVRTDRQEAA